MYNFGPMALIGLTLAVGAAVGLPDRAASGAAGIGALGRRAHGARSAGTAPVHGADVDRRLADHLHRHVCAAPDPDLLPGPLRGPGTSRPWLAGVPLFLHMFIQALAAPA